MWEWLSQHETTFWWLGVISLITFLGSLILIPLLVIRMRADYFSRPHGVPKRGERRHPAIRLVLLVLKNLAGTLFVLAGIAMLVLPGQGILTIVIGITLLNFPGKRRLEIWSIRQTGVLRVINWMRRKADKPPLEVPPVDDAH